jgi:hypothetical protein
MSEVVARIHVTVAPSVRATLDALAELGETLGHAGAGDVVMAAWMKCADRVMQAIQQVPAGAAKANWN